MAIIKQFGTDGATYDTKDYPFVLIKDKRVEGRFSTIKKAHKGRLMTALNNPDSIIQLYNAKTKRFINWKRDDLKTFEKYKEDPSEYFEKFWKRS